jgi:hypothetical protein
MATSRVPAPKDPRDNPEQANQEIKSIIDSTVSDYPTPEFPPDDVVTLPGGLIKDGRVIKDVVVQELTGEHEEALARVSSPQNYNPFRFLDTLLECGTVSIGDSGDVKKTLKDLLIGDRDAVLLGIRRATYGNEIKLTDWDCPNCGQRASLTMGLEDIPVTELGDVEAESVFDLELRRGRRARVRLANGHDHAAVFESMKYTAAERDTIMLSRCVLTLTQADGTERSLAGFPSLARGMAMPDRQKIIRELNKRAPGPRFNEIPYTHDACGSEVKLAVTIDDLFLYAE